MASETSQPVNDADAVVGQCRHLRSKGMYITGCLNPAVEDGNVGDGNCWCGQTQHVIGPDDNFAERHSVPPRPQLLRRAGVTHAEFVHGPHASQRPCDYPLQPRIRPTTRLDMTSPTDCHCFSLR